MLLLDSQVALWVLAGHPQLGIRTAAVIESATVVHVSTATVWELTIKSMLGKIDVPDDLVTTFQTEGFELLSITPQHAAALPQFPELRRHDPFDRLLVAQASSLGLRLVTADRVLLSQGYPFTFDART